MSTAPRNTEPQPSAPGDGYTGMPAWVKWFLIAAVLVAVVIVVVLVGGGSGHGFKHAPALGEHVADLLEGRADVVPMLRPGPRASGPTQPR